MVRFTARRSAPELVAPARPTPHEVKTLSDIDDFSECRYYASAIEFFSRDPTVDNVHPARSIVAALAAALVYNYPIAGRLREIPGGKLVVDCTGEGVVFVEADADVSLEELGGGQPHYPCAEEFVCDAVVERGSGAVDVVGRPLFYMQVTRLKDGAFVLGFQVCHVIGDAAGVTQFIRAIAELARGEAHPSISPVWEREIFKARDPPRVRHDVYPAYDPSSPSKTVLGDHDGMTTLTTRCCRRRRKIWLGNTSALAPRSSPLYAGM